MVPRKAIPLPDAHDPARHVPADAVTNVLAGKTADGSAPFDLRIPFSKNPDSRTAAGTLLRSVIENLNGTLPPEHLTPLTAKLLSHLSKTGLQSPEAIAAFPASTLADAIREAPHLIGTKASIAAVLRGHQCRNEQAASALQQTLPSDVPERLVLWQRGDYRLEEATDPRHLQKDSADLKHCVGTAFNSAALQEKGLSPHDSEAINYLHYWMKMKTGETRILTLTRLGRPLVTLEHDTELRAILQICGYRNQTPEFGDAFLKPLCGALSAIREPFGLTKIHNLPVPPPNTILHASGAFLPVTEDYIADALAGSVQLPPHPSASLLKAAAASPLITLDITAATQSALDTLEEAACHLISSSKSVCLPALQSSGDIHLTAARRG